MSCPRSQNIKLLTELRLVPRYTEKEELEKSHITEK